MEVHAAMPRRVAYSRCGGLGPGGGLGAEPPPERFDFRVFEAQEQVVGNSSERKRRRAAL